MKTSKARFPIFLSVICALSLGSVPLVLANDGQAQPVEVEDHEPNARPIEKKVSEVPHLPTQMLPEMSKPSVFQKIKSFVQNEEKEESSAPQGNLGPKTAAEKTPSDPAALRKTDKKEEAKEEQKHSKTASDAESESREKPTHQSDEDHNASKTDENETDESLSERHQEEEHSSTVDKEAKEVVAEFKDFQNKAEDVDTKQSQIMKYAENRLDEIDEAFSEAHPAAGAPGQAVAQLHQEFHEKLDELKTQTRESREALKKQIKELKSELKEILVAHKQEKETQDKDSGVRKEEIRELRERTAELRAGFRQFRDAWRQKLQLMIADYQARIQSLPEEFKDWKWPILPEVPELPEV